MRHPMPAKGSKSSGLSVRLANNSSARPVLAHQLHHNLTEEQKALHHVAKIMEEGEDARFESTQGKLPVEAAYIIMKRVTEAVGEPVNPIGLSTFNKLSALRTEPALKLLLTHTWKDFFTKQAKEREMHTSASTGNINLSSSLPNGLGTRRPTSAKSLSKKKTEESDEGIQIIYLTLCRRVEEFWSKLSLPKADQKFYRKTLLRGPAESLDQCKEIANYIEMLHLHYNTTIEVLEAIRERESNVSRFYSMLLSLNEKYNRQNYGANFGGITSSRPSSSSLKSRYESIAQQQHDRLETNMLWKEEIIILLDLIRCNTLDVVKAVQTWRQVLYRPLPFVWNGVNYLEKIKHDMSIIETDNYLKILECLPLRYEDLLCVVFFPPDTGSFSQSLQSSHVRLPPMSTDGGTQNLKTHQTQSSVVVQNTEAITALLAEFQTNIDQDELYSTAMVVLEDAALQDAIAVESQSLRARGAFIPTLKLGLTPPSQAQAKGNKNGTISQPGSFNSNISGLTTGAGRGGVSENTMRMFNNTIKSEQGQYAEDFAV